MSSQSCNIRVMARFRPLNDREKAMKENQTVLQFPDENSVIVTTNPPFAFDRVFPPDSTQEEVFEHVQSTIIDVLNAYNGTIICYGQTGSGKSHTMFGDKSNEEMWGIIPRSNLLMFSAISQQQENESSPGEISIKCSFLEIYMENIQDLLNPKKDPKTIKIRESKTLGIYVEGLVEEYVSDENEIMELISIGESSRSVAKTNMNAKSSRSHSILIIQVEQKSIDGSVKRGKLNLVDLAGSEKVAKTNAEGQTLEEAKKINQSLSLLGNCIHALTDSKREHIPFRDSKLTRLLQDSLGGNTKTTLIVTGSPHYSNVDETLSTLKFGARAKTIKNTVKVNQQKSAAELQAIVNALSKELSSLKQYSISLENLVNYFKSENYPIPQHLEVLSKENSSINPPLDQNNNNNHSFNLTSTPAKSKAVRNSIAISTPSTNPSSTSNGSVNRSSNSSGLTSSTSSSSISTLSGSSSSVSDDKLYDPLTLIELSIEMEKLREENSSSIDKYKDEISDITIKYESTLEELRVLKCQSESDSQQFSLEKQNQTKEISLLKEIERNLSLDSKSKDLKIQNYSQKYEDFKLLSNQILQYLDRKKSMDYFDSGNNSSNLSIQQLLTILEETPDDLNVEDILRYLSEEEILSMQLKLQLQNKVEQFDQKNLELLKEIDQLQMNSKMIHDEILINNNSSNDDDDDDQNNNNILSTPPLNDNNNSNALLSPSSSISTTIASSSSSILKYEKEISELKQLNQDQNIKQLLSQNQITNLQNDLLSIQNKLNQEKKQRQKELKSHEELQLAFNNYIKENEEKLNRFDSERSELLIQNQTHLKSLQDLELQAQDLQDQLTSTQRLLANRRVVKVVRGDEKSMKRAFEQKETFGQQFLKKTGRSLF